MVQFHKGIFQSCILDNHLMLHTLYLTVFCDSHYVDLWENLHVVYTLLSRSPMFMKTSNEHTLCWLNAAVVGGEMSLASALFSTLILTRHTSLAPVQLAQCSMSSQVCWTRPHITVAAINWMIDDLVLQAHWLGDSVCGILHVQ